MVGRQYCERAATARLHDCTDYTSGASSGTSTDSEYTQEWRCPDVGSDGSRSIRIARVEGVRGVRCECGPDRKSRAPPLMKRGISRSIEGICDEVKSFVAHIRDETRIPGDLRVCLAGLHNVVDPHRPPSPGGPLTSRPVSRQHDWLTHLQDPTGRRCSDHRRGESSVESDTTDPVAARERCCVSRVHRRSLVRPAYGCRLFAWRPDDSQSGLSREP